MFALDLSPTVMSWLMLLALAITSTNAWQRRLKRNWKALHRLIYPAAILGAFHYLWLVKADTRTPLIYLFVLLALLAFRLPMRGLITESNETLRSNAG